MLKDGIDMINPIMVKIKVIVHAHVFPFSNPHAMTNPTRPRPTKTAEISPAAHPSTVPIIPPSAPINAPNPMYTTLPINSKTARIVTPVGLVF